MSKTKTRRIITLSASILLAFSLITLIAVDTLSNFIPISSGVISSAVLLITGLMHLLDNAETIVSLARDTRTTRTVNDASRDQRQQTVEDYLRNKIRDFESKRVSFIDMEYMPTSVANMTNYSASSEESFSDPYRLYASHRQFVLIGLPGVGKSTVLRELFCIVAKAHLEDNSEPIPLWIDLSDPTNPIDADEMLRHWCESPARYNLDVGFEQTQVTRPFVLMLDGLNEMPLQSRKERAKSLSAWLEKHDDVQAIITCRVRDYQDDASIFLGRHIPLIYVQPFEREQIAKFLRQSRTVSKRVVDRLLREIDRDDAILELARLPLHLGMLTQISIWWQEEYHYTLKKLPNRTKTLFEEYLVERYNYERKKRRIYYTWEKLESRLEKLAYKMVAPRNKSEGAFVTTEKQVKKVIGPKAVKDAYNLYLFKPRSANDEGANPNVEFLHQALHGYFALPRLERSLDREARWRNPFVRSSPARTANIIRQIGDLGDTAEIAVDTLLPLIESPHREIRVASIGALETIGIPAINPLIKQLEKDDEAVVEPSMQILRKIGEPILGPLLIHALKKEDPVFNRRIAAMLDNFPNVPYKLTQALRSSEYNKQDFKGFVASVLGELKSSRAVQALIPLLEDEDYEVRADIAWALGQIGSEVAIKPLIKQIKREQHKFVQRYLANAIEKIGLEALVAVSESLRDRDKERRRNVLNTLHYIFADKQHLYTIYKLVNSDRPDRHKLLRRYITRILTQSYARN